MTIGQITISAADWMAAKASDRMELLVIPAGQSAAMPDAGAVPAATDAGQSNTNSEHSGNQRDRSLLAAQENYKRVAARIKARLAASGASDTKTPIPSSGDPTRITVVETLDEQNSPLAAALMANTPRVGPETNASGPAGTTDEHSITTPASEAMTSDEQARSPTERDDPTKTPLDRGEALEPLYPKGLWQDLFVDKNGSDTAPDQTR